MKSLSLTQEGLLLYEDLNYEVFKMVHKRLFKELYEWAGEFRTVELSKGETSFARAKHIDSNLQSIMDKLSKDGYLADLDFDEFVGKLASYYAELIVLHPFREGNGRALRTFLALLAQSTGWHIAWDEMKPQENIDASIAAYKGDEAPLRIMLRKIITPVDIFWGGPYEFI